MSGFFNLDGKLYKFGLLICDLFLIGLLWALFSLPIVTIGATTTALYYVCTKKHSGDDVYIVKSFLKSFRENFIKATVIFLILLCVSFVLWTNLHILRQIDWGWLNRPISIVLWVVLFHVFLVATNVFCILSRFEVTVFAALRYGLFMGYRHLFTTITNWVTLLAIFLASIFVPMLLLLMGGIYIYFTSFAFIRLFCQHSEEFGGVNNGFERIPELERIDG